MLLFSVHAIFATSEVEIKNSRFPLITESADELIKEPIIWKCKTVDVVLSGYYSPNPNQKRYLNGSYENEMAINGGRKTFYGTKPKYGIVATDPEVFPENTMLLYRDPVDGEIKFFKAKDRGSAIEGNRIDQYCGHGMRGLVRAERIGMTEVKVIVPKLVIQLNWNA